MACFIYSMHVSSMASIVVGLERQTDRQKDRQIQPNGKRKTDRRPTDIQRDRQIERHM